MTVYKWGAGGAVDAAATTNLTGVVVAGLATGGYVVTWQTGPSATNQSIQGQVYDAAGNAVGGVFTASTGTLDFAPSIAGLSNGGFAISWTDDPTGNGTADTTQTEIYGANNQAISGPTTSTDLFAGDKNDIDSSTVAIPGGDGTGFNVIHFAATGNHFNYASFSNTSSNGVEGATTPTGTASAVTASTSYSGSEFVAVMIDTIANNPEVDVLFGLFGSFTKVNTTMGTVTPFLADPQVAGLINGDAAVVWQENSGPAPDTDGLSIHGQIMAPNGTKVGSEFTVETEAAGNQQNPSVTALQDGGFVVTWQTNASGINYIDGQEYDINGNRVGFEFTVNSQSASGQTNPSISQLADGRLIVAWETPNGVVTGIHSQILDPRNGVIQGPLSGPGATLYGSFFGNSEIIAGSGNNVLIALTGNNLMYGGSGNDVLQSGPGVDTMYGGAGNDTFIVNNAADMVVENPNTGFNVVQTMVNNYVLPANVESLQLFGSATTGFGNNQGDVLYDNPNLVSTLYGGTGNDTYLIRHNTDTIVENPGAGTNTAVTTVDDFNLPANVQILKLEQFATIGASAYPGTVLYANPTLGSTLTGYGMGDEFASGTGNDTFTTGGGGAGTFIFSAGFGQDTVTDFAGNDKVLFSTSIFNSFSSVMAHTAQVGASAVITDPGNAADKLTLTNFPVANLAAGNFGFF